MYTLEDIQAVDMEVADAITKEFELSIPLGRKKI